MGAVISLDNNEDIKQNVLLKRLAGPEAISDNDPYWNKLFSFNFNVPQWNRKLQKRFVDSADQLFQSFLYNAPSSNNFAVLIKVFLRRCTELEASMKCNNKIFLWQTMNSLILLRYICVFLTERLSANELLNMFEDRSKPASDDEDDMLTLADELRNASTAADGTPLPKAEEFSRALVDILCHLPIKFLQSDDVVFSEMTCGVHHETVRVLIALLSTQLPSAEVTQNTPFLQFLMRYTVKAKDLVCVFLQNFLYQTMEIPDEVRHQKAESLVISLASSVWSAFQKGVMIAPNDTDEDASADAGSDGVTNEFPPQTLASLSTTLLLHLVCYPTAPTSAGSVPSDIVNPFKEKVSLFQNAQEVSSLANLEASFKLDFTALYNRLCERVDAGDRLAMLLLYMLLHNNCGFRNFVLSRINLENLVVPCIKALNAGVSPRNANPTAFRATSHHTYLALIVVLILSEDDFFCKIIHETVESIFLQKHPTNNMDRYLHTNTMAALANMSTYFKHLSPLVCNKLLGLLETMTKRQAKLVRQMVEHAGNMDEPNASADLKLLTGRRNSGSASLDRGEELPVDHHETLSVGLRHVPESDSSREFKESLNQDISVLEEGIRNILEILNACLANNLRTNTDLIYGILYKRELFELYRNHPFYEDLVWNIYMVINHFAGKIEAHCTVNASSITPPATPSTGKASSASNLIVSVSCVMETIKKAAVEWPTDRLHKFPELKFKYIEDENTVDFFVPYIWRLTNATVGIYFNPAAIRLHNVITDEVQYAQDESPVTQHASV